MALQKRKHVDTPSIFSRPPFTRPIFKPVPTEIETSLCMRRFNAGKRKHPDVRYRKISVHIAGRRFIRMAFTPTIGMCRTALYMVVLDVSVIFAYLSINT